MNLNRIFAVLALIITANIASAALPPLRNEERIAYASHIVTGHVTSVTMHENPRGEAWSDYIYTVELTVSGVEKGSDLSVGQTLTFTYWKWGKHPVGWCGNSGQYSMIHSGENIKAYVVKLDSGYELLTPNGFERIYSVLTSA